ncbi:hypothetical protein H072_5159 [Dactylellina haptotyla CBS 200.50]|uniref:Major facilitator superfamily (MFS) profile domain-containing protein n=1 Tax=Dactylellina haptotyla (strain CBS 200.50) TaxID=1284197 RepID=S8ADG4_DACHA|nr:hypothetical protein H072_5159 [Dactylellina haptotyla CBS 200.50]
MGQQEEQPPAFWRFRSSNGFIVFSVCFAIFVDVLLYGCIVPYVAPARFQLDSSSAGARSGVAEEDVQRWLAILLAVYGLGFSLGSPAFGWLADRYRNRWWPLMSGLVLLLCGTLMLWFSSMVQLLCVARFIQGLATACIWSVGLALVIDTVGSSNAGESLGLVAMSMSIGFVGAPSVSGFIYDRFGYDMVFICMVVMVIFDIVLRILIIEKKDAVKWVLKETDPNDPRRPLLPPVNDGPNFDLQPHAHPIITLCKSPRLVTAVFISFVEAIIMTSFETVLPLHTKETFGYTSTLAGLSFAVVVFGDFFSTYAGRLSDRIGATPCVVTGCITMAITLFLCRYTDSPSTESQVLLWVLLLAVGLSHCLVFVPAYSEMSLVVEEIEKEKPGVFGPYGAFAQSYGLGNLAYAAGTTVGPLWSGFMRHSLGWGWLTFALAVFSLLAAIPSYMFLGGPRITKQEDEEGDSIEGY